MRHKLSGRQLSRNSPHRHAMLRNMAGSLLRHETIHTTLPKAKELRRVVEPLITLGKSDSEANRRLAFSRLRDSDIVSKLFADLGPALPHPAGRLYADPAHGAAGRGQRADGADAAGRSAGARGRAERRWRQTASRSVRPNRRQRSSLQRTRRPQSAATKSQAGQDQGGEGSQGGSGRQAGARHQKSDGKSGQQEVRSQNHKEVSPPRGGPREVRDGHRD